VSDRCRDGEFAILKSGNFACALCALCFFVCGVCVSPSASRLTSQASLLFVSVFAYAGGHASVSVFRLGPSAIVPSAYSYKYRPHKIEEYNRIKTDPP
jgi:hypothetical protein